MKKLITVSLLIITLLVGCATMTAEQAKKAKQNFNKFPDKILVP